MCLPIRRAEAHPRWCGENHKVGGVDCHIHGSSPLVRGKPLKDRKGYEGARLIPAGAGKTRGRPSRQRPARAHPRWCGENVTAFSILWFQSGSSPLVRGKRVYCEDNPCVSRLIPAGAGKTTRVQLLPLAAAGSSPLVQGKRWGRLIPQGRTGLIPAGAGKTALPTRANAPLRAHPRWCGENHSVPRTRGKYWRLIPAGAGKTPQWWTRLRLWRAHPRWCGENRLTYTGERTLEGSSPLVRGKPQCAPYQGKILAAHPRWCGENAPVVDQAAVVAGSSPLVRGKRQIVSCAVVKCGLIPAGAGKTLSH